MFDNTNSQIPKFPNSQIPKFPNSQIPCHLTHSPDHGCTYCMLYPIEKEGNTMSEVVGGYGGVVGGVGYGFGGGGVGAILVLFILLVIITKAFCI